MRTIIRKRSRRDPSRRRSHKDVDYQVTSHQDYIGDLGSFKTFKEAAEKVVGACISSGEAKLDIIVWSEAGARFIGGDDAVEQYREDPEASVFERFEFKCNAVGRVP